MMMATIKMRRRIQKNVPIVISRSSPSRTSSLRSREGREEKALTVTKSRANIKPAEKKEIQYIPRKVGPTGVIQMPPAQAARKMTRKNTSTVGQRLALRPSTVKSTVKNKAIASANNNSTNIIVYPFPYSCLFDEYLTILYYSKLYYSKFFFM
jgi:hypothetical protein